MINLIKLCVGISSFEQLQSLRRSRLVSVPGMEGLFHVHRTRMRPRRAPEIVSGQGSLFWVIRGAICCRQPVMALLATTDEEGRKCCDIVLAPQLTRTVPLPRRPFQGWRYLEQRDAPADLDLGRNGDNDLELASELAKMGLI